MTTQERAAEIDKLMALADYYSAAYRDACSANATDHGVVERYKETRATLRAALEAEMADGERYRLVRKMLIEEHHAQGKEIDRQVDAARAVLAAANFQTEDQGSQQQSAPDASLIGGVKHLSAAWQPIETANPVNGQRAIVACEDFVAEAWFDGERSEWWCAGNHWTDAVGSPIYPTHLMSMPEPPSAPAADEEYSGPDELVDDAWREARATLPKCDNSQQCSPEARYDEVSHGLTSLTIKCRLCGGIRRSDWD